MARKKNAPPPDFEKHAAFLDHLREVVGAKNDFALAAHMGWAPPTVSKVRNHRIALSAAALITVHLKTGMGMRDILGAVNYVN